MSASDLPAGPGTYALILDLCTPARAAVGRLEGANLPPGRYVYVGSALGSGGLRARLSRHLQADKTLRWHIDALTARFPVIEVVAASSGERLECDWVQRLLALPAATAPVLGFGSSDCRAGCPAHLVRVPDGLDAVGIRRALLGATVTISLRKELPCVT